MKLVPYSEASRACCYVAQTVRQRPLSPEFRFNPREVREDFVVDYVERRRDFI